MKNGRCHGECEAIDKYLLQQIGTFEDGYLVRGKWGKNNAWYTGTFKKSLPEGEGGTWVLGNGYSCTGSWKEGKLVSGVLSCPDGKKVNGTWDGYTWIVAETGVPFPLQANFF